MEHATSHAQRKAEGPGRRASVVRGAPPPLHGGPLALLRFMRRNGMLNLRYARLLAGLCGAATSPPTAAGCAPTASPSSRRTWCSRSGRRDGWSLAAGRGSGTARRSAATRASSRSGPRPCSGQECTISAFQHVSIGRECVIADRVMLIDFDHGVVDVERPIREQGIYKRDVRVGHNVWIGYGACILRGVTVGQQRDHRDQLRGDRATCRTTPSWAAFRRASSACARSRAACAGASRWSTGLPCWRAGRGGPPRWRRTGARTLTSRTRPPPRRPTPRWRSCEGAGSPTHDGMSARMAAFDALARAAAAGARARALVAAAVPATPAASISALCVVRDAHGRWLAGRRASWVATWPGRWALGAGGAVEVGENPADTLAPRAARGVAGTPRAAWRRGARAGAVRARAARGPGACTPATARRSSSTKSTTPTPGGPRTRRAGPRRTARSGAWESCAG